MSQNQNAADTLRGRPSKKIFAGIAATAVVVIATPYLLGYLGWIKPLGGTGWWVLLLVGSALLIKIFAGDIANGEFLFHKHGYDNCVMTLGSSFTALALQVTAVKDLFPGLAPLSGVLSDPIRARILQLVAFFVISLLLTLCTARICRDIKDGKKGEGRGWAFANAAVGLALLGAYIALLVSKEWRNVIRDPLCSWNAHRSRDDRYPETRPKQRFGQDRRRHRLISSSGGQHSLLLVRSSEISGVTAAALGLGILLIGLYLVLWLLGVLAYVFGLLVGR